MYEKIPTELKHEVAWVNVWNTSKIPMQTTTRRGASSGDPDTWGTFHDAVKNVKLGIYDGIGYVFHGTGLIGIDIDAGKDVDGFLSPLAIDIIRCCESYTEWSRSGRGVHILIKGRLPFKGRNNRQGLEIYQTGRYFIMTGRCLIYQEIKRNQDAIDHIISTYFSDARDVNCEMSIRPQRIYTPLYRKPSEKTVWLQPKYPEIKPGSRNLSLASLAGQMHTQGYSKHEIYKTLLYCNSVACKPPLNQSEIESIVNSITKYRR